MENQTDKLTQAKQQFKNAVDNAHNKLEQAKTRWKSEWANLEPQAKEKVNTLLQQCTQAAQTLNKTIASAVSGAKEELMKAATQAQNLATTLKQHTRKQKLDSIKY